MEFFFHAFKPIFLYETLQVTYQINQKNVPKIRYGTIRKIEGDAIFLKSTK